LAYPPADRIPILLLAAGSSSRMGQSKQLLMIDHEPLLRRTARTAIHSNVGEIVIVLGSNEQAHKAVIEDLPVHIVANPNWPKGMGTSIKLGLDYVRTQWPECKAVIISVCDQPYLTAIHLNNLALKFINSDQPIIASFYDNTLGVPVVFDHALFNELSRIDDQEGAKKIVQRMGNSVVPIPFPLGEVDLDTKDDYDTFNKQ